MRLKKIGQVAVIYIKIEVTKYTF